MPAFPSENIAHTEVTDHRIPRLARISSHRQQDTKPSAEVPHLVPFPDSREAEDDLRDLALAWETLANTGVEPARARARQLLRRSATAYPNDAPTLAALGYEEQADGNLGEARVLYRRALAVDPTLTEAATNLGVIEAESGDYPSAIEVLRSAFERSPGRSAAGMDLARVLCLAAKNEGARASTLRVLEFNPDRNSAKRFLRNLNAQHPNCNEN
jgi:Flp pilus assembly protein TadD